VPVLPGALELARAGVFPGGSQRNHGHVSHQIDWGDTDTTEQLILADAQTSGGLLIAVAPDRAAALAAALSQRGVAPREIGKVTGDIGRISITRD
jgi:selenide,water dikinase